MLELVPGAEVEVAHESPAGWCALVVDGDGARFEVVTGPAAASASTRAHGLAAAGLAVPGEYRTGDGWALAALTPGGALSLPMNRMQPVEVVEVMARSLRSIHELDPAGFGSRFDLATRWPGAIERAATMADDELPPALRYRPPAEIAALLSDSRPDEPADDQVIVHGSFGLGALYLAPGALTAEAITFLQTYRCGVGDRHVDLAAAIAEVAAVFTAELVPLFLDTYGLAHPDPLRIDHYSLLALFS